MSGSLYSAALGNALTYLPATTAAVSNAKPVESGLASGLFNTTYQIGSVLVLAIMVAIAGATTTSSDAGDPIVALNEGFQQAFLAICQKMYTKEKCGDTIFLL